jgi:hypothetical protein
MNRFVEVARAAVLAALVAAGTPALAADPTLDQVYQAVRAGELARAQGMMNEVLRDHPNSAKAHYVEAEILAREGRAGAAQGELSRAEQLEPGLPFASSTAVQELRGAIASAGARHAPLVPGIAPAAASGFPWGMLLIGLVVVLAVYAIVRARRNAAVVPYAGGAAAPGYGGPTYGAPAYGAPPMGPMGGGMGSGIVGGLVTGAALGAGVVAGEALAHDLIDGHAARRDLPVPDAQALPADSDLGGQDFGINDAGSWDDGGGLGGGGGDDWG